MKAYIGFYKKSCHCRVDMVVRRRKVMAMKGRLYVCFRASNWYYYKVVTIAKKFTWSWACYKIRLLTDNFKNPTQPGWARHGWAILVFRLQTPARKCEIINCLPCGGDGWVDDRTFGHVTIKNFSDGLKTNFFQLYGFADAWSSAISHLLPRGRGGTPANFG